MQIKKSFVLLPLIILLSFCSSPDKKTENSKNENIKENSTGKPNLLDSIISNEKLIALTNYSSTDYFIYRGKPMGYQYELATRFANFLDVNLEMKVEKQLERSFELLDSGYVDILTMGLTETKSRKSKFLFSRPIMFTRQILVQRKPDGWQKMKTRDEIESHYIKHPLELAKKTIYVHRGSVYVSRLRDIMNDIADTIYIIEDERETEELIEAVSKKEIDYTIADEHVALLDAAFYNNIYVKTPISFRQKIAWAVRSDQKELLDTINSWLKSFHKTLEFKLIYNKYFKNYKAQKRKNKSLYNSYGKGHLSPYDKIIKKEAKKIGWDWRLLASLIYQESQFKPDVVSWVGARGLMQLMPDVMKKYGVDTTSTPEVQIAAGVKYLHSLDRELPDEITDSLERIKFVLAAYNTGMGHVFDARRLAKKHNKNPNIWTNNVDYYILHLSEKKYYNDPVVYYGYVRGKETYNFVQEILERYEIYKTLIESDSN